MRIATNYQITQLKYNKLKKEKEKKIQHSFIPLVIQFRVQIFMGLIQSSQVISFNHLIGVTKMAQIYAEELDHGQGMDRVYLYSTRNVCPWIPQTPISINIHIQSLPNVLFIDIHNLTKTHFKKKMHRISYTYGPTNQ